MSNFDQEDQQAMFRYLDENGYDGIADWAQDSDYVWSDIDGWVDESNNPVNIWLQLYDALEAAGELPSSKVPEVKRADPELDLLIMEEEIIELNAKIQEMFDRKDELQKKVSELRRALTTLKEMGYR